MLEKLVLVVLRSLFLYGYEWYRRGSLAVAVMLPLLLFYGSGSLLVAVSTVASILVFYAATRMYRLGFYALVVAGIPAAWMAATQGVLEVLAGHDPLTRSLGVGLRSLAYSLTGLYMLHSYNPMEAAWLLYRLGGCRAALPALLLPRITGQGLREAVEALHAHRLKGARPWDTLGVLLYRSWESIDYYSEGALQRVWGCRPRPLYDKRALALQASLLALPLLALLFYHLSP